MFQAKKEVYAITELRDGCIYKTRRITTIWLDVKPRTVEEENALAQHYGGDMLVNTTETRVV